MTLAGLAVAGLAPAAKAQDPPPLSLEDGAFLETAFDQAQRVTVDVRLNDQGPFPFVVDTGANSSVVSLETAQHCRLPAAGTASVHGIVSAEPAPLVRVGQLRVGGVKSANLTLPVVPASRLGAAGILGLDVMRNRYMVLGFRDRTFEISPTQSGASFGRGSNSRIVRKEDPVTVPARYRSGQLVIIEAYVAGQQITAFLDSGSQVTVGNRALRDLVHSVRPELFQRVVRTELISATGQRSPAEFAPLSNLRLGGASLGDPLAAFADLHIFELWDLQSRPTLLIGVDTLRRFQQVAFDFKRRSITFWR